MAGPFVRRRELSSHPPAEASSGGQAENYIKNGTLETFSRWSVVQIDGSVVDPADDEDKYTSRVLLTGKKPDADGVIQIGIVPRQIKPDEVGLITLSGETFARLEGPTGEDYCDVQQDSFLLKSGTGPITILYDPGPANPEADPEGERIALVRFGGGMACDEVHEFYIEGTPTTGSCALGYTLDRDPDDAIDPVYESLSFPYNCTAEDFRTILLTHSVGLTVNDLIVSEGPWPFKAIYVLWRGDFQRSINLPSRNSVGFNNGAEVKMRKASSTNWKGFLP